MNITKENVIKIFEDGLSNIIIDDGDCHSLNVSDCYEGGGIDMSFQVRSDYDILGIVRLYCSVNSMEFLDKIDTMQEWQSFGIKYFITFAAFPDIAERYDSMNSRAKSQKSDYDFTHELSSGEFTKLAIKFKKKINEARQFNLKSRYDNVRRKLEVLSDTFNLDFFPKKRTVIFEKTKLEPDMDYGKVDEA